MIFKFIIKFKNIFIINILFLLSFNQLCFAYVFEKKSQLSPIKMTYEELNQITTSMRNQLFSSLSMDQQNKAYQYIKLSSEDMTLEKKGDIVLSREDPLPELSRDLYIIYRSESGSISEININFGDSKRTISIQGNSKDAVEAMNLFLFDKFDRKTVIIAGVIIRMVVYFICLIFSIILIVYSASKKELNSIFRIAGIVVGGSLIIIGVIILTSSKVFPGFEIYQESATALVKYSAEISFLALLLTILFFPIGVYFNYKFSGNKKGDS
jgi:hypothetical protein